MCTVGTRKTKLNCNLKLSSLSSESILSSPSHALVIFRNARSFRCVTTLKATLQTPLPLQGGIRIEKKGKERKGRAM